LRILAEAHVEQAVGGEAHGAAVVVRRLVWDVVDQLVTRERAAHQVEARRRSHVREREARDADVDSVAPAV
jgi:hypothetical protein